MIRKLYAEFVKSRVKAGADIVQAITPDKAHLLHMVLGIAGEAGELVDAIKKHAIYNKPLDLENIVEEIGDIEFYLEGLRSSLVIYRSDILEANMLKLNKRFGDKYSDAAAIARKDKEVRL